MGEVSVKLLLYSQTWILYINGYLLDIPLASLPAKQFGRYPNA